MSAISASVPTTSTGRPPPNAKQQVVFWQKQDRTLSAIAMFKLIKDLTRPPESLTTPPATQYPVRQRPRSRSRSRARSQSPAVRDGRPRSPGGSGFGPGLGRRTDQDAGDSGWSLHFDSTEGEDDEGDETEEGAVKVVAVIRALRYEDDGSDVMRYVESFSQLLSIPGDYYSRRAWRRHTGTRTLLLALEEGLAWKSEADCASKDDYEVREVQRMEGIRLAFEVLGWALGDRLGEAHFEKQGGYLTFLPLLRHLSPPRDPPHAPDPQIVAQLFAHICSNNYSFLTLFQSPPQSLGDISTVLGDVLLRPSTSGALKLVCVYLYGGSQKAGDKESAWTGSFEGEEGSDQANLAQSVFQVLLVTAQASTLNLFTLTSQLPQLTDFLVTRLYGPAEERKYEVTFPPSELWSDAIPEKENLRPAWRKPSQRMRMVYLVLLKKMLEAGVDQKVTWRLFALVRSNSISKAVSEEILSSSSSADIVSSPASLEPPSPTTASTPRPTNRGRPNLHVNVQESRQDDDKLQPEVLDLIRHALKSRCPDVFVFKGGIGDSLGGLELPDAGPSWLKGDKGFNFSCWLHITKLNQPLTLVHVSQQGSKGPLFQIRILENSQIGITTGVHKPTTSPLEHTQPDHADEVICAAPDALVPHFQWVHFAVGCRKPRGHETGEIRIFVNGVRVGAMRMSFPVPLPTAPPPPSLAQGGVKQEVPAKAIRISVGRAYQDGKEKRVFGKEGMGREEENEWMLGRVLLLEEAVPEDLVLLMHHLGPRYTGNFQEAMGKFLTYEGATSINIYLHGLARSSKDNKLFAQPSNSILVRAIRSGHAIPEEIIVLSVSPRDYEADEDICINGAVPHVHRAKQLRHGMVKLTGHVRPFKATSLDESIQTVGGGLVVLKMVSMSRTKEELLVTLGILRDTIKDSWTASEEMERIHGFDLLAAILRPKAATLLDQPCAKVILAMIGINMDKPNTAAVHNSVAYRSLGLEFELWSYASDDVVRYYLKHFEYLLVASKHKRFNLLRTFQKSAMVRKMLYALRSGLFTLEVVPDVVDTLQLALEARWSGEDAIKPIFSYLISALCQNNMTFSLTISNEPPPYQLPAALILAKIAELCHDPIRLNKLNRSVALHRLLVIILSSNSSYYVVLPCLDLLEHCITTAGLESFQKSFEAEGGIALLARTLPPIWKSEIQQFINRMVLGKEPAKKLLSVPLIACLLSALDWLLQAAGDNEDGGRPQSARTRSGTMTSIKSASGMSPMVIGTKAPETASDRSDTGLEDLLKELTRIYRTHSTFRKHISHKKVEAILPNFADFAAVSSNGKPEVVKGQREAAVAWLSALAELGNLPKALSTQLELLVEQLRIAPTSPKLSSSMVMSPASPGPASYFGQSFSSRFGTSPGIPSSPGRRRPSADAGMGSLPGFTRSKSIMERKVPLKRVISGESILEGGKDKNAAWKMIIIQTDSQSHGKMTLERKEHWQKVSQIDWPSQAAILRAENGLWPDKVEGVTWRLDGSEGPLRMRARLERIEDVPEHGIVRTRNKLRDAIPSVDELSSAVSRINAAPWEDPFALALGEAAPLFEGQSTALPAADGSDILGNSAIASGSISTDPAGEAHHEEHDDVDSYVEVEDDGDDKMKKIARTLQAGEVVEEAHNIVRIVGVDACPGLLILGKRNLYLIDGLVQTGDGEVIDAKDAQKDVLSIPSGTLVELDAGDQQSHRWQYNEIIESNKRAFLFRDVALELYFSDKRNFLIVFKDQRERQTVVQRIGSKNDHRDVVSKSIIGNFVLDTMAKAIDRSEQQLEALQRKWQNREISNFAYLQLLNQYANRTPNDVTQYPVFPWVLADYTSETLNLSSESSFRDLSFPMGALTEVRREAAVERYSATESVGEKPFHYGTHYSSSMIVCGYMIRLSPFTEISLALQGGNFDLADRLFSSVPKAWDSASSDNRGDVRELVPEFFYSPAFLLNLNRHDFGRKQASGDTVDDVALPPWALGDPHLFIHRHREALETEYVSRHLASWIDLTFGYKQQDPTSFNCFHPLSYRGAIDLENIEDEGEKAASTAIIHNFGQTPLQIFKLPHPNRFVAGRSELPIGVRFGAAEHWQLMFRSILPITESSNPIDVINPPSGPETKPKVSQRHRLLVPGSLHLSVQYGFTDGSIRVYYQDVTTKLAYLIEGIYPVHTVFASPTLLITVSSQGVILAWRLNLKGSGNRRGDVSLQREATLRGHPNKVTCVTGNTSWSLLLSGSDDGTAVVWDTNRLRYIRTLQTGRNEPIVFCAINEADGQIALASKRYIYLYSLNGHPIASTSIGDCVSNIESDRASEDSEDPYEDEFTGGISFLNREFLKYGALFVVGVGPRVVLYRCAPGVKDSFGIQPVRPWELVVQGALHRSDDHNGGDCCMVQYIGETLYAAFAPIEEKKKYCLYQWSLPDGPARHVAESISHSCMANRCSRHFGLLEPKRHCGGCGGAFCGTHALHIETFTMRYCDSCRAHLSLASAQGILNSRRDTLMPPSGQNSRRGSVGHDTRAARPSIARSHSQPGSENNTTVRIE